MTITKKNLFLGQQLTRILLAAIKNKAFNEIITKSPFNFKHSNINFVAIYRDGVQISAKPLQPDFENDRFIRSCMIIAILEKVFEYFCRNNLILLNSHLNLGSHYIFHIREKHIRGTQKSHLWIHQNHQLEVGILTLFVHSC